jgi:hypothetical protein
MTTSQIKKKLKSIYSHITLIYLYLDFENKV